MHLKTNGFMIKDNNDNAMGDGDDSVAVAAAW